MNSKINPHILQYIEKIEQNKIAACEDQHLLVKHVRKCFETEDIYTNDEQLENYLGLSRYFPYEYIFDWEEFVLALHCCTYRVKDDMPRWPDLFLLMGRGAGKDGYLAYESMCLISPYNGIKNYDVDICANSEEQAKAPFLDIHGILETPENTKKLEKHFYWNKEEIISLKTKSKIKYRTNNPKGKDGLRSGIVVFNEIHQFQDYANINVFTTGLGKKKHPRRTYATTNGDVRDGPLDDLLAKSMQILKGDIPDNGMLPFICRLNNKDEVHKKENWDMPNPSLKYLPNLQEEIAKEYLDWKENPIQFTAFMTKRMNIPDGNKDIEVTSWENIMACCQEEVPDLTGKTGVVGIDFASVTDFAAVCIAIEEGDKIYTVSHSWICSQSPDIPRMKIPLLEWEKKGFLTIVDDVEISPHLLAEWIQYMGQKYNLSMIALDNFRYGLISRALSDIGFSKKEFRNVKLVSPSDIMKVAPVIESFFVRQAFVFGDDPLMRWSINNTKMVRSSRIVGSDTGNFYYAKIESKSRKTDLFMALVAAMTIRDEMLNDYGDAIADMPVFIY